MTVITGRKCDVDRGTRNIGWQSMARQRRGITRGGRSDDGAPTDSNDLK